MTSPSTDRNCTNCGHSESLHKMTNGYKPYGSCNFQHDLCGCTNYVASSDFVARVQKARRLLAAGDEDALLAWLLDASVEDVRQVQR